MTISVSEKSYMESAESALELKLREVMHSPYLCLQLCIANRFICESDSR